MKKLAFICAMVLCMALAAPGVSLSVQQDAQETAGKMALVNLNTASAKDLQGLPGVGKVTAERIIAFREEVGPFASCEDLVKVKGIGKKKLEKIRELVTVE